jgi:hypothetical protein
VFENVLILFLMASCQSQPFSTVSLIYREPLGSRPHFKGRSWHGWVDIVFLRGAMMHSMNFRTSKQNFCRKLFLMGGVTLQL